MTKNQVKFYVDDDEKKRLEVLAKLRHVSVPTYVKLTALGVKVQQVKEVFVESENLFHEENTLSDKDKAVLKSILERNTKDGYIRYDVEFNSQLARMAKRLLEKENKTSQKSE